MSTFAAGGANEGAQSTTPHRVHNFSAGPGCLPLEVLREIQSELLSYEGSGMSFIEMSHRDADGPVQSTITNTTNLIKELLQVPPNYEVLFMHGGAHGQFAGMPMNLAYETNKIDFVDSGVWAMKAMAEAKKVCPDVHVCVKFTDGVVHPSQWRYRPDAAYIHVCLNETINGIEFLEDFALPPCPTTGAPAPVLVADATSTLFSRPINISAYGCVYCSSGKNIGPAGVCVVIVRRDLLDRKPHPCVPGILDLRALSTSAPIPSLYSTPPCFQIYCVHKILRNLKALGSEGSSNALEVVRARADARAQAVYSVIDGSRGFYVNTVRTDSRSRMNVCFRISTTQKRRAVAGATGPASYEESDFDVPLESEFVADTERHNMFQLFKHPLFGGLRVTMYNGITDEAVRCVVQYMKDFHKRHAPEL